MSSMLSPPMAPAAALAKVAPQGPATRLPAMVAIVFQPMVLLINLSKSAKASPRPPSNRPLG